MKIFKKSETDSTTKLLQNISTPTKLSEIGLKAGEWIGYNLGKPIGRAMDAESADDIVGAIIENSMEQFRPEDMEDTETHLLEKLLTDGFITDHVTGSEHNAVFWIIGEGWLDESLWNIYFSSFSEGMLNGADKALEELESESAPNVVSLFGR